MTQGIFVQLLNYLTTYGQLALDLIQNKLWQTFAAIICVAVAGLIFPLPILLVISTIYSVYHGRQEVVFEFAGYSLSAPIFNVITAAIGLAFIAYILSFLASYAIIRLNMRWQYNVYWRLLARIGEPISLGRQGLEAEGGRRTVGYMMRLTGSGALIGRLLSNGLYNFMVCFVSLAAVIWFDFRAAFILLAVSLALVPLYANVLQGISRVRAEMMGKRRELRGDLNNAIETVLTHAPFASVIIQDKASELKLEPFYVGANRQYLGLNRMGLLFGLHLFLVVICFVVFLRPQETGISEREFMLFAALIVFVRAATGLMGLMGNLTRNYTNLSALRRALFPRPILLQWKGGSSGEVRLLLNEANRDYILKPGVVYLIAVDRPKDSSEFAAFSAQLSASIHTDERRKQLLYIEHKEWQPSGDGPDTEMLAVPIGGKPVSLEIKKSTFSIDEIAVAIVERSAWRTLGPRLQAEPECKDMVMLVRLNPGRDDHRLNKGMPVIVINKGVAEKVTSYQDYLRDFDNCKVIKPRAVVTEGDDAEILDEDEY